MKSEINSDFDMRVTKRNGQLEIMSFDKILSRIKKLGNEAKIQINFTSLAMKVIDQLYDTIPTTKIDELTAEQCASLSTLNPDYGILASRVIISNHQKNTDDSFSKAMKKLYNFKDNNGRVSPMISEQVFKLINSNKKLLDNFIVNERDYLIDYFGFKTLERSYLLKIGNNIVERIQYMWLRVALGIHGSNLDLVKETYDLMSQKFFTHATPTLFNSGTPSPQLSSCYLIAMEDDSVDGIYNTLKDCALISKYSGGIGLHIHNIRAKGSYIRGTNGKTDGIVPMLRVFNSTARYINQSGKRNGSFAIYIEPWHADIEDFLDLKKNQGDEELKARDLFYAIWMPDLFMERVRDDGKWSLFCPDECQGLSDVFADDFKQLYEKYENENKARRTVNARDIWFKILDSQMETGTPYILFKDAVNQKSNQKNIGTIKSSNLCCEIVQYSDKNETAVCNLASIALPSFVNEETKQFDYEKLHHVTKVVTNNLNQIIDINFYPTEKTKKSNLLHRPIGIGVQGLADTFILMDVAFHSEEAKVINKNIFEKIYHAALEKSYELSRARYFNLLNNYPCERMEEEMKLMTTQYPELMGAYSTFVGSPASKGILQFDMWNVTPSERYDWTTLKELIQTYGLRNSLLIAPMPTASTSQILGFNECFEPLTSNIYSRSTLAGEFVLANKYLMKELIQLGLWNEKIKNNIISNKGSIQQISTIPEHIRNKYKIVWEIPMKHIIDMASDRGAFICQTQSMNLWVEDPNYGVLTNMHFYSWKKGLKTGMYYLRRKAKHQAQQFTIEPEKNSSKSEICDMCSA